MEFKVNSFVKVVENGHFDWLVYIVLKVVVGYLLAARLSFLILLLARILNSFVTLR